MRYSIDDQELRWNALAPTIGYKRGFLSTFIGAEPSWFDHRRVVRHQSGQRAILADPYEGAVEREEVLEFARLHGMTLDHWGRGLWVPTQTVAIVLRVVDAAIALPYFSSAVENPRAVFTWVPQPKVFMPVGTNMQALRQQISRKRAARRVSQVSA